jgi:hypothetical protein
VNYLPGIVMGQKIKLFFNDLVRDYLGEREIQALPLPLSIIATLQRLFPVVEFWGDARPDERRATFVIAGLQRPSPAGSITLGEDNTWRRWSDAKISEASTALGAMRLTDDYAPVDRLIGVE